MKHFQLYGKSHNDVRWDRSDERDVGELTREKAKISNLCQNLLFEESGSVTTENIYWDAHVLKINTDGVLKSHWSIFRDWMSSTVDGDSPLLQTD